MGGYAVGFHGHARYTKDLDIWVDSTEANAEQLMAALDAFGFGSLKLTKEDFQMSGQVVQLGREPIRIDLLTSVKGALFTDCWPHRFEVEIDELKCQVIGLEELRRVKAATARPQDLADQDSLSDS